MAQENTKPTQQALFERFVNIYTELATLTDDVKQLTEEAKELYPDADISNMKKVAKIKAESKLGDAVEKTEAFLEAVDTFTKG